MSAGMRETLFWFGGIGCGLVIGGYGEPLTMAFGMLVALACAFGIHWPFRPLTNGDTRVDD